MDLTYTPEQERLRQELRTTLPVDDAGDAGPR